MSFLIIPSILEIIGYIASFSIGLVLGLIGSGGSILAIPILVYLFSVEPIEEATAYSLFIVGVTSSVGAIEKYRSSLVDIEIGLLFGIPSILSVFYTRMWIVPNIPDVLLETETFCITDRMLILGLFSLLIISASLMMIFKKEIKFENRGKRKIVWLIFQGIIIGFLSGLVGIGGGFLIVPTLLFIAKIPFKKAVGTTLFVIALKSIIGFTADIANYEINWSFLMTISTIAIFGIFIGNLYSRRITSYYLKKYFGWFALTVGIVIFLVESFS
jgi:uncharacterized membrane protein YfcA